MRVGVYVDGYNLYYGARSSCGRGTAGWRWLDVRQLIESVITTQRSWTDVTIEKVIYCTARVDSNTNPSAHADQDVYLKALKATSSVSLLSSGVFRWEVGVGRSFPSARQDVRHAVAEEAPGVVDRGGS